MKALTDNSCASAERDFNWMIKTYPLTSELSEKAVLALEALNAVAATRLKSLSDMGTTHERVTGPFEGYFIASYGCSVGELGDEYIGSYKICETRPETYWKAKHRLIGWCSHTEPTSLAAMELAEATARERILQTFLSPGPEQQSSRGAAMDIFPASYWAARRR